jgi:hypothetical protein
VLDLVFLIILNEHHESEGPWTVKKAIEKLLRGTMLIDLIAIIPFGGILKSVVSEKTNQHLLLIKAVRIVNGVSLLDYNRYKKQLKEHQQKKLVKILNNPDLAENQ